MHVVKLLNHRILTDDEFASLKNTVAMPAMLENRMRLTTPPNDQNGTASAFVRSIKDWMHSNCSSICYMKQHVSGTLDVYFRSKVDAAGFKMYWAERTWGD